MRPHLLTLLFKLRELHRNQGLTRSELEARKLRKFRRLARHASRHSPYYAQLVRDHRIDLATCVPADFPVLTKSDLMANFDRIAVDRRITRQALSDFLQGSVDPERAFLGRYRVIHTSGSSGQVGYFVYDRADWARGIAQQIRSRPDPGQRRRGGKFRVGYYGALGGHFAGVSMFSSAMSGPARFFVQGRAFEINSPLPEVIEALDDFQPEYLIGYTTAVKLLAQRQREGRLHLSLCGLNTVGEGMTPADRRFLEESFGCPVNGVYACSEHLMMGHAASGSDSMVLRDDDLIFEFQDDHSIVTNLFNWTLPLIRYRMSDILRPLASTAGSPYPVIGSLVGRSERMPTFINAQGQEDFISPHTVNEIFVPGVTGFQMQLLEGNRFRFAVCLDASLGAEARTAAVGGVERRLDQILSQKGMANVGYEVKVIERLPLHPSTRKFQLIVDERARSQAELGEAQAVL